MKKIFKNLIIFLILIICQNAFCYTLSENELNKIIYNKINSETKNQLKDVEYKINIQNNSFGNIITNDSLQPIIEISSSQDFNPISYRRVTIKDSKGNIIKTLPICIHTLIYQNVLVALQNIAYGDEINNTNSKTEKRETSKLYGKTLNKLSGNIISSRNIAKGSIIQKNSIKQKALIEKNQDVDIVFQGQGIQVAIKGKALKEGVLGEKILVRSDKYNKTYSAVIDSATKVTVRI